MNERIGELLVRENLLSADQLAKAREESRTKGGRLGAQITALGFLDESELTDCDGWRSRWEQAVADIPPPERPGRQDRLTEPHPLEIQP